MCENKEFAMDKQELADDMLDQVAGGANEGDTVEFEVEAVSTNDGFKVGTPTVEGAVVSGKVIANGKGKKIYVMKYKSKKNEKKKIGHRQPYTKVQIVSIQG